MMELNDAMTQEETVSAIGDELSRPSILLWHVEAQENHQPFLAEELYERVAPRLILMWRLNECTRITRRVRQRGDGSDEITYEVDFGLVRGSFGAHLIRLVR